MKEIKAQEKLKQLLRKKIRIQDVGEELVGAQKQARFWDNKVRSLAQKKHLMEEALFNMI